MATAAADFTGMDAGEQNIEADQGQQQEVEQVEQSQSPNAGEQTEQPQLDGRKGPANIRNSIKAASEALPEQAQAFKELGNSYFREQAYKQHFPTPQEAATAKQLIEGIGGVEGATQLQERIASYDAQDAGLRDGNPEVLDSAFKDFPEGMVALAPHFFEKLSQVNPQAFQAAIAPHAFGMLESAGLIDFVDQMANDSDPKAKIQQLQQWLVGQKQHVGTLKQPETKVPGQDRLAQEKQQLQTEKEQIFNDRVQEKVNSSVGPELKKAVDQYAKSYKLNDKQRARFEASLGDRIVKEMAADKTYLGQVKLRNQQKDRNHDNVASFMSSEFNRRIADAALAEAQELYGTPKSGSAPTTGVVKPNTPQTGPNGAPVFVSQRPQDSEFAQYSGLDMDIIQGRARLQNGRFVTWRK